jgi:energy-coupling factor transporter ATP-binding protein EcfA2
VSKKHPNPPQVAPPAATGNAGPQFEAKVGAFYLLSLLSGSEPRGLPGATIRRVEFQQRGSGRPLDDVVVQATNANGSEAVLEIQAKRTLNFTASDAEFKDVVARMWEAAQKPEFATSRYELAVAIARTTTRVENICQEVLHWARQHSNSAPFAANVNQEKFASNGMRSFVEVFRANLSAAGAPTDDETVWRLLRRFQILAFDFESPGSDYEHRARTRARLVLSTDQANRVAEIWPILIDHAGACARAGGVLDRLAVATPLETRHGFRFDQRADLRPVYNRLLDAANNALDEIKDDVGGVRLARTELIDQAYAALESSRILHIVGAPGVGKSSVMKHLAQRLQPEGRIIVLRNGRIVPRGWLSMAHEIGCPVPQDEFFNELGCGGGATLFIDNIDQIDEVGDWATMTDLLRGVARNPGWRVVVTGGVGNDDWKSQLPEQVNKAGIATLLVDAITDDETAVLSAGNPALAIILGSDHPARGIARNLFYLSRMIELGADQTGAAAGIATEMDLARLWWRYGGGRGEDETRFARLKVLRAMGAQVVSHHGRVAFKADDLDSPTVAELLRFDSLREDIRGATVAFRHDVLRDWTVGFLLHEDAELLNTIPMDKPLPLGLARGLEIAARIALESDATGARWSVLLASVERDGCHGSWKRPVLLALPRSEQALTLFQGLKMVLLDHDGRRLSEIIRLMIAVESEPLAKLIARIQPSVTIPSGVGDMVVPKSLGWTWLVLWLVANAKLLPNAVVLDISKVFQAWLIATQNQPLPLNATIAEILFEWLALIEEAMAPRMLRDMRDALPSLNIPHLREVRDEIRMTAFAFAHLNPAAAERYLKGLDTDAVRHHELEAILRAPGNLAKAAPAALVDFALGAIIEKEDPDDFYGSRRDRLGPFGVHDHVFSRASPGQGPFLELLEHAPAEGLRLVRAVVEHATQWRRDQYAEAQQPFPRLSVPFRSSTKSFEGDWPVYYWARSVTPSVITASALMALEAWGHRQIEAGRPFDEVLHDVLGPDGSSLAFVLVAVDLALSHWPKARDTVWPMVATPALLQFDEARATRDIAGVDRMLAFEQEASTSRAKRADLDAKPSRRSRLSDTIGYYVFHAEPKLLEGLRLALERARIEIRQKPNDDEDPIKGLRAVAERAVRMTNADHWPLVKVSLEDGSEMEVRQFQRDPEEVSLINAETARVEADMQHQSIRAKIQFALFDRAKSTAEIVAEGIEWAKALLVKTEPQPAQDDEQEDFNKEWDRRAVVMAVALTARDYDAPDRSDVVAWALPLLCAAATEKGKEYRGNDQIEYNMAAIATLGLIALYRRDEDVATRNALLRLASHQHLSVLKALGCQFPDLAKVDSRLPRTLIRIMMTSSVHPRRGDTEHQNEANQTAYRQKVETSIAAELGWLDAAGGEPVWPELPAWLSRPRRGIHIGGWTEETEEDDELRHAVPDHYADEHALGEMVGHLIRLTVGELPPWIVELATHFLQWTVEGNGPHGEKDRDRDNRPYTWNCHFFEFLGILSVALPHSDVVAMFLDPIIRFKDEAFHDVMAAFLRGFDRAMQAIDTRKPENPAAIRARLADRIRLGRNFKRLGEEKSFTSETHAGDALNAMFYQPSNFVNVGRPSISDSWNGLDATMPTLTNLVVDAPSSGYLAILFLNLVESSPRAALLPFVVEATTAWCSAYGVDTNFWSEKGIGGRVCAWLDRAFAADSAYVSVIPRVADHLLNCLDILIRSGVAQAQGIEDCIVRMGEERKSA